MALTKVITASDEVVALDERIVTSSLTQHVKLFLPPVGDGTGGTVAEGHSITVGQNAAGGALIMLTNRGNFVVLVKNGDTLRLSVWGDTVEHRWVASAALPDTPAADTLAVSGTQEASMRSVIKVVNVTDPPALGANAEQFWTVSAPGVEFGDQVIATMDQDLGMSIFWAYVESAGNIRFMMSNPTGSTINVAAGTMTALVTRPAGTLPAGASLTPTSWMRRKRPDGTIGLIPMWDEVDGS